MLGTDLWGGRTAGGQRSRPRIAPKGAGDAAAPPTAGLSQAAPSPAGRPLKSRPNWRGGLVNVTVSSAGRICPGPSGARADLAVPKDVEGRVAFGASAPRRDSKYKAGEGSGHLPPSLLPSLPPPGCQPRPGSPAKGPGAGGGSWRRGAGCSFPPEYPLSFSLLPDAGGCFLS